MRLASGLGVWLQARMQAHDGVDFRHAVNVPAEAPIDPTTPDCVAAGRAERRRPRSDGTLRGHSRKLIEETLAANDGNISHAARQLHVSRGTLYRRLKSWQRPG